jgi:hypothetical protein
MYMSSQKTISTKFALSGSDTGSTVDCGSLHRSMSLASRIFGKRPAVSALRGAVAMAEPGRLERRNPRANCGKTRQLCPAAGRALSEQQLSRLKHVEPLPLPGEDLLRLPASVWATLVVSQAKQG